MYQIDKEQFGAFLTQLRKEKNWTQKELGERLYVSDKTVSKWERGLSLPNIDLLIPIAEVLEVTVAELLQGERIPQEKQMNLQEVEELVTRSLELSSDKQQAFRQRRRRWTITFFCCLGIWVLETLLTILLGCSYEDLGWTYLTMSLMMFIFAGYFSMGSPFVLPAYYDENEISAFSHGAFRMNLPGIRFSNRNWIYILNAGRISTLSAGLLLPVLFFAIDRLLPRELYPFSIFLVLPVVLFFFIPMYVAGKKHS